MSKFIECGTCATSIAPNAVSCPKCGAPNEGPMGLIECRTCAKEIAASASSCPACGAPNEIAKGSKDFWVYLIAWLILGGLGVHKFYLGKTGMGVFYIVLLLFGFVTFGLGGLVLLGFLIYDLIMLLLGKTKDETGRILKP